MDSVLLTQHFLAEITERTSLVRKDSFDDFMELNYGTRLENDVNLEEYVCQLFNVLLLPSMNLRELTRSIFYSTFWYMKHRQWDRLYLATYGSQTHSFLSFRWLFFFAVFYITYLMLQIFYFKRTVGFTLEYIMIGLCSLACALVMKFLRWLARIILLLIYASVWIFTVFHFYNKPTGYIPLLTAVVGLIFIAVMNYVMYPYVLRALSRLRGGVAPKIYVDDESKTPRYEIHQDAWCSAPYTCVYEGEMLNGRPHGLGSWIDTSPQGESLHGYWHRGFPIGPFESVESETRNILTCLRIVYGTIRGRDWMWLGRGPLCMGVATVETCVSGGSFFKKFPICRYITEVKQCPCPRRQCDCIHQIFKNHFYLHVNDEQPLKSLTVSINRKNRALHIPGHQSTKTRETKVQVTLRRDRGAGPQGYTLRLGDGWVPTTSKEGLLFIHGIYHSLDDALKRFGHFLAMGHFPPHIKPFVWNWPSSSNPLLYGWAKDNATNPENHRDFMRFLLSIRNSGINTLSIMCHSMGTRFLMHSFPMVQSIFKRKVVTDIFSDNELANSGGFLNTSMGEGLPASPMLSPHVSPLIDSARASSSGPTSSSISSSSTMNSPSALRSSRQFASGYTSSGAAATAAIAWEGDGMELANLILLNPDYEVDLFTGYYNTLSSYCRTITIYADSRDGALRMAHRINSQASLGANTQALYDEHGNILDLDIIDTGELDANVSSSRHGFFNVARPMVDDLYDLIINGNRAEDRSSRLKPYRSVYRFTIVPPTVMDI